MKKGVGVYSTKYPIENFRIKITCQELWSKKGLRGFFKNSADSQHEPASETESLILSWQEKVFSQEEFEKYSNLSNCRTDLEKSYHAVINSSDFVRRSLHFYTKIDNETDEMPCGEVEQMRIMLAGPANSDKILCEITFNKMSGTFVIRPDFNDIDCNPYPIQLKSKKFLYDLKNASKQKKLPEPQPIAFNPTILNRQSSTKPSKFLLLFQIDYATSFTRDNLHIFYELILPNGCKVTDESKIHGSTHTSLKNRRNNRHNYGHAVDMELSFQEHHSNMDQALSLVFHVISTDYWRRQRTEGVAAVRIPLKVHSSRQVVKCFDPSCFQSAMARLSQYFIGGIMLMDFKDLAVSFNRYGMKAASTGDIQLSVGVLLQNE